MNEVKGNKRRPKGPSAWGDLNKTKAAAGAIIHQEAERLKVKSERLRMLRLGRPENASPPDN